MSLSGTTGTSSNSSEYSSSPPLQIAQTQVPVTINNHQQQQQQQQPHQPINYYQPQYNHNPHQHNQYQQPHHDYYHPPPSSYYQNQPQQQTGWTANPHPNQNLASNQPIQQQQQPQQQHPQALAQNQHQQYYNPYPPYAQQQYPQHQQPQQHALVGLSRFVQQQSPSLPPAPSPIPTALTVPPPHVSPIPRILQHSQNKVTRELNSPKGNPGPGNTASASAAVAPPHIPAAATASSQMIPARFQNMTKGARTKANMRKLKQEQISDPNAEAPAAGAAGPSSASAGNVATVASVPLKRNSPKKRSSGELAASRAERNSIDDAIEAALSRSGSGSGSSGAASNLKTGQEPEPDTTDGGNGNGTPGKVKRTRAKRGSKVKTEPGEPKAKVKRERKSSPIAGSKRKKRSSTATASEVAEIDVANSLLDLKKSPPKEAPTAGPSRRKSKSRSPGKSSPAVREGVRKMLAARSTPNKRSSRGSSNATATVEKDKDKNREKEKQKISPIKFEIIPPDSDEDEVEEIEELAGTTSSGSPRKTPRNRARRGTVTRLRIKKEEPEPPKPAAAAASPRQKSPVQAKVPKPKAKKAARSPRLSRAALAKLKQEPVDIEPEPPMEEIIDFADLNTAEELELVPADSPVPGPSTTKSPKRKSPSKSPTRRTSSPRRKKYVPKPPRKLPVNPVPIKSPVIYPTKTNIEYMKQIKEDKKVKGKKSQNNMQQQSLKVVNGGTKVKFFRGGVEEDNYEALNKINIRERVFQVQEFDESVPWICCFCGYGSLELKLGDLFGPYYIGIPDSDQKKETWVHQDCALWAGGVLLVGSTLRGLDDAVYHAEKFACTICNHKGPTIDCLQRGCKKIVHFICGKLEGWSLDYQTFHSYCDEHKGVCSLYSGR